MQTKKDVQFSTPNPWNSEEEFYENDIESQIRNLENCGFGGGVTVAMAIEALVKQYFEGWDAGGIAGARWDKKTVRASDGWKDLQKSIAWQYVEGYENALCVEIINHAKHK